MPNSTYGGVRGRKTKVGRKLLRFPSTRFLFEEVLPDNNKNKKRQGEERALLWVRFSPCLLVRESEWWGVSFGKRSQ